MTSGVLQTGIYQTRDELVEAIREHYVEDQTLVGIADLCQVSVRCVRRIITEHDMVRNVRPVTDRKPMSIRGHELKLVRDPCWREWCGGCVFHPGVGA